MKISGAILIVSLSIGLCNISNLPISAPALFVAMGALVVFVYRTMEHFTRDKRRKP